MALTERTEVDKIEIVGEHKFVQVRTATVIERDGTEISRTFHRHTLEPSDNSGSSWSNTDISGETAEVQAVCNAVWTDAVRTAYQNAVDALQAEESSEE